MMTVEQALAAADEMYGLGSFVVESPDVHLVLPHLVTVRVVDDSSAGLLWLGHRCNVAYSREAFR